MSEIREQAKNCIKKVRFSLKMPPVRGDKQGGNVFVPPGTVLSIRGEKEQKQTHKRRAWLAVNRRLAAPAFFCVTPHRRKIGRKTV